MNQEKKARMKRDAVLNEYIQHKTDCPIATGWLDIECDCGRELAVDYVREILEKLAFAVRHVHANGTGGQPSIHRWLKESQELLAPEKEKP